MNRELLFTNSNRRFITFIASISLISNHSLNIICAISPSKFLITSEDNIHLYRLNLNHYTKKNNNNKIYNLNHTKNKPKKKKKWTRSNYISTKNPMLTNFFLIRWCSPHIFMTPWANKIIFWAQKFIF